MALDYTAVLLDPIYDSLGVVGLLYAATDPVELVVLDKTAGVAVNAGGVELDTFAPAACVRVAELTAHGLAVEDLDDLHLTMNGKDWVVKSCQHRATPDGVGEITMILTEAT